VAKIIRCRCPVCGLLVTQNRLNEEHHFEFIIQEIGSKGRGGIYHIYRKADKVEGNALVYFKAILAGKLHDIADSLLEEARAEVAKGKKTKVVEEEIPAYETDEYDEFVPSSQLSSAIGYDEPVIAELEADDYDEPVIAELGASKRGGEEEWQGSGEVSPLTVMEG